MANSASLVYGTLKGNGINTEGMSFEEAVEKFKEIGGSDNWNAKIQRKEEEEKSVEKPQPKEESKGKEQEKKEYKITDSDKDVIGDAIYYASKDGLENLTVDKIIEQVNKDFDGYIGTTEKEQAFRDYLSAKGYRDKNFTAKFDEYGIPDNETIREKNKFLSENKIWDPSKLTNKEFNDLAEKAMQRFGIKDKELAKDLLVAELE